MNEHMNFMHQKWLERTGANLTKNGMETFVVDSAKDVVPLVESLVKDGATVSFGGSVSLDETGVLDHLRSGRYTCLDRDAPGVDRDEVLRQTFFADAYFTSANAITQNGEIYQVDGNGNRVAAMAFGPKQVIVVAGRNKIVADIPAAKLRVAQVAAPPNGRRLNLDTPCAITGVCSDCRSKQRMCSIETITKRQRDPNRLKVILVNEELGY